MKKEEVRVTFSITPTRTESVCVVSIEGDGEDGGFLSPPKGGFLSTSEDHNFAEKFLRFLRYQEFEPTKRCEYIGCGSYRYYFTDEDSKRIERWLLAHGAKKRITHAPPRHFR